MKDKPLFTMPTAATQPRSTKMWRSQASIISVLFLINYDIATSLGPDHQLALSSSPQQPHFHLPCPLADLQISCSSCNFVPNKFPSVYTSLSRSRDSMQLWTKFPLKFHESINLKSVQQAMLQNQKPYRLGHLDDAAFKLLRIGLQGALDLLLAVSGMMKQ
ncbi:hypothetical protein SS50377_26666 [Spironucleus salmonicida]|uniref:Uncharacterized protein n=1 Tax=Spironucleus salmonicida TaxID=348837 RepID=A0A9P8LLJ6_9EUKA|nr:hypothetical protein SS50377_26666 [Spironucleus salmonicida]